MSIWGVMFIIGIIVVAIVLSKQIKAEVREWRMNR